MQTKLSAVKIGKFEPSENLLQWWANEVDKWRGVKR